MPVRDTPSPGWPGGRVVAAGVEIGAGRAVAARSSARPHVGLNLAHPDTGPRTYKAELGRAAAKAMTMSSP